jgi:4-hydroxyphenylpyruvate dioxygenase
VKTSIATVSISGDLAEKLAAIAAAGFDGVEIFENDLLTFDATPREVGRMVRDAGLELALFQPFRDFEGMPEPHRSRAFDRAERKFDLMGELGADLILVCSNTSSVSLGGVDRAADDLRALGERAAARGIRVGYEALAWGRHVSDHRDAWEIVRRAGHPAVGLILDSFHTLSRRLDPDSIRAIPADRIFLVQLADAPRIDMDLVYLSRHFRNMPGEGDLPVKDFLRAVLATGFDGWLSLEVFNDQFRGGSATSISVDGHRSLLYLMDQVHREEPAVALPAMPDRVAVTGVEFIEFASDLASAPELVAFLHGMGFRKAGRHVSKDVTLYRQGGINLVVNTEREGFAHSAWAMHGTGVCAIGLRVGDAAATVARAGALGARMFAQAVGPGELTIPAIRGVGGGLIYFIDQSPELSKVWETEFVPVAEAAAVADAGLSAVDHVGQTMPYDEMLSSLLFYTAIFRTRKTPMVDVIDPSGVVHSQAIENGDGTLRLTLNGAENPRTFAGRFVAESFGSAVQHVAFASRDIFASAAALAANGFRTLRISPNYFDDVEARFGLDPGLADRLRAANILYDRDDHGEYFQLYAPNFGGGFFFEIVERRGYRGYGAANAPFRIAAQKRHLRPEAIPRR